MVTYFPQVTQLLIKKLEAWENYTFLNTSKSLFKKSSNAAEAKTVTFWK